jgi:hypothetical protein
LTFYAMSSKVYARASRHSHQVDLTLACTRQRHPVLYLIHLMHLPPMACHHISPRTTNRQLRHNQIRVQVLLRTPLTLPPHRKPEVAAERPAQSRTVHRPSSSDHPPSLSWLYTWYFIYSVVPYLVDRPSHIYKKSGSPSCCLSYSAPARGSPRV